MTDLLFDTPWWFPTLIAFVGVAFYISGNRRQASRMRAVGLGLVGLGILVAVVSYLVDTPKEKCQKRTREFVESVVQRDWKRFGSLLAPDARFRYGSSWQIEGREKLESTVKADAERIGLKSAPITHLEAHETGPLITTRMNVFSTQEMTLERPIESEWELVWRQSGDQWLLQEIRAVQIPGITPDQAEHALPKH